VSGQRLSLDRARDFTNRFRLGQFFGKHLPHLPLTDIALTDSAEQRTANEVDCADKRIENEHLLLENGVGRSHCGGNDHNPDDAEDYANCLTYHSFASPQLCSDCAYPVTLAQVQELRHVA